MLAVTKVQELGR